MNDDFAEARSLAEGVLRGELPLLETAQRLTSALIGTKLERHRIATLFNGVASECDDLPLGSSRIYWDPEALRQRDQQATEYESKIRSQYLDACRELLEITKGC